jgi:parallel beta helix pectate lyase-like protein
MSIKNIRISRQNRGKGLLTALFTLIGVVLHAGLLHTQIEPNQLIAVPSFESCSIYFKTDDNSGKYTTEFKLKNEKNGIWGSFVDWVGSNPEKWEKTFDLVYNNKDKMLRGSIVNLKENRKYEVRLTHKKDGKKRVYTTLFTTWSSDVPVAKVINIKDIAKPGTCLEITDKGSNNGWIKYTAPKGVVFKGPQKGKPGISIKNACYIILENLTIEGGGRFAIDIEDSQNIRIINCEISNWGRIGKQDLSKDGKYYTEKGRSINMDGAINIENSGNIVLERCYIHDPRGRSNSWKYSHPAGPEVVTVRSTGGVVLRYNDFIGSDPHRWNDAVEGKGNGYEDGGFYRDSDIYGNMFAFGNDDGIELDGGQINIRVYKNKFEGFLCAISTAPCLLGPSYSFKNLIVNLGDESGHSNTAFKNGHGTYGLGQVFFFNNTVYGNSNGFGNYGGPRKPNPNDSKLKGTTRNNIYNCRKLISKQILSRKNDFDYDLFWTGNPDADLEIKLDLVTKGLEKNSIFGKPEFTGAENGNFGLKSGSKGIDQGIVVDNFIETFNGKAPDIGAFEHGKKLTLPYRPIPVSVDKSQINFEAKQGALASEQTVTAEVTAETPYSHKFTVRKNKVFDWFTVEPSEGVFKNGEKILFKVKLNQDKLKEPKLYRGLFLLRQENGFSRPVTVYAQIHGNQNIKKKGQGFSLYIEAEKPAGKQVFDIVDDSNASEDKCVFLNPEKLRILAEKALLYEFEVLETGKYQILLRVKSQEPVGRHDSLFISLDNEEPKPLHLRSKTDWGWSGGNRTSSRKFYELINMKKGKHTIKIFPRESVYVDLILITNETGLVSY